MRGLASSPSPDRPSQELAWERFALEDPEFYVAHRWTGERFYVHGAEIVEEALAWARPLRRGQALDIGCGLGRMTRALDAHFDEVAGIDVSTEMLRQAAERHPEHDIRWLRIDAGAFPLADATIDFAFSHDVFQHIPSPEVIGGYLRELRRTLRADARAVLHFDTQPRPWYRPLLYRLPDRLLPRAQRRFIRRYPLRSAALHAMIADARLEIVDERQTATRFHQVLLTPGA